MHLKSLSLHKHEIGILLCYVSQSNCCNLTRLLYFFLFRMHSKKLYMFGSISCQFCIDVPQVKQMSFKILKSQKEKGKCMSLVADVQKEFLRKREDTDYREDRKLYMMVSILLTLFTFLAAGFYS